MHISINLRSDIPIYIQIVEQVRQQLANGILKPGDRLPTVRAMASDLHINFNTVSRAYRILDESGIISTQHGRGTYILDMPPPDTKAIISTETLSELTQQYLKQVTNLGFSAEDAIKHIEQQNKNIDNNVSRETSKG